MLVNDDISSINFGLNYDDDWCSHGDGGNKMKTKNIIFEDSLAPDEEDICGDTSNSTGSSRMEITDDNKLSVSDFHPETRQKRQQVTSNEIESTDTFTRCGEFLDRYRRIFGIAILLFVIIDVILLVFLISKTNSNNNGKVKNNVNDPEISAVPTATTFRNSSTAMPSETTENTTVFIPTQPDNSFDTYMGSLSLATSENLQIPINSTQQGRFEVLEVVPHDTNSFTQGLEILSSTKLGIMKKLHMLRNIKEQKPDFESIMANNTNASNDSEQLKEYIGGDDPFFGAMPSAFVLESTGHYGKSALQIVELTTGKIVEKLELDDFYFGEGCTYYYAPATSTSSTTASLSLRIVQITWTRGQGFVYELSLDTANKTSVTAGAAATDTATKIGSIPDGNSSNWLLTKVGDFQFSSLTTNGEGWGIVYHPLRNQFIVSDGSEYLHFWELTETKVESSLWPSTKTTTSLSFDFVLVGKVTVRRYPQPSSSGPSSPKTSTSVRRLNELEWDPYSFGGATILANIWQTNEIVRIWVGISEEVIGDDTSLNGTDAINSKVNVLDEGNMGKVSHSYDLSSLVGLVGSTRWGAVLNGIAYVYESSSSSDHTAIILDAAINETQSSITGTRNNTSANEAVAGEDDIVDHNMLSSSQRTHNEFWVTGKYWPRMYRIRLIDDSSKDI